MAGVWPDSLVAEFGERRAALFMGAGVSAEAASEFGMQVPTWPELLFELAEKLPKKNARKTTRRLVRQAQMLDAAQILSDSIPKADLTTFLRDKFNITLSGNAGIYESMIGIDPTIMFTTNFDQFLETAAIQLSGGHGYNVCRYNEDHLLNDIRSPIRSIAKVHGCITQPNNIIMTRTSYFEAQKKFGPFFRIVEASLIVNTLLFVGYSFSDPDIQLILEHNYLSAPTAHTHSALVQRFEHPSIREALRKTYNIDFIEYPRGEHHRVAPMIEDLRQQVVAYRASKGIV